MSIDKQNFRASCSAVFLALLPCNGANAEITANDWGSWGQVVAEGGLGFIDPSLEKGRLWLEGQMRWDNDWQHWYQGMARAALGYSLSDRATLWLGYTYLPTQNVGQPYVAQQDVWPAFRYVLPTDFGTVTFRTMFETNFLRGDQPRYRPRQMLRYMRPFDFEPRLSMIAWDEVFVNINSTYWGGQAGFNQNRGFIGGGWTFDPGFRVELGYMNQYIDSSDHQHQTMHNLIMGSLFVGF
ncbi:DUF2490 domain-containing protein [Methylococcus mesophilus]|uniref:DUF2490 domain-containing protein n=1 Tax=Methylococcus mesophilus TaxID=2993564 RepID=UPI00224AE6CC|nr:DUF2490 domain-containing protein [Methylococcus mesophilus]UZR28023.1 DUF2490 domain-containing protein [Methylococcus mesophilus]